MLIKMHSRGITLPEELKEYTSSKIRLTLGRYFDKIQRADIYLTDVNGPKGGEDMMCKVKVAISGQPPVVVQETNQTLRESINACAHRVKRTLGRRFKRPLSHRRFRPDSEKLSEALD